jgi:hypothetical protein
LGFKFDCWITGEVNLANWDKGKIADLSDDDLSALADNALRLRNQTIIDLCNIEIERRANRKAVQRSSRTSIT